MSLKDLLLPSIYIYGIRHFQVVTTGQASCYNPVVLSHFGLKVLKEVMDLGLLLFVYAVGLQAGPRFFRTFRRCGLQFVGLGTVSAGAVATVILARALRLPCDLAPDLYAGTMTCTPALAAAIDVVERLVAGGRSNVSVGYGVAYPFGMISVVLLIQFLRVNMEEVWLIHSSV